MKLPSTNHLKIPITRDKFPFEINLYFFVGPITEDGFPKIVIDLEIGYLDLEDPYEFQCVYCEGEFEAFILEYEEYKFIVTPELWCQNRYLIKIDIL